MNIRLQKSRSIGVLAAAALLLVSSHAHALSISAEFNLANSTIANPVTAFGANDLRLDLTTGDVIALDIVVSNFSTDLITATFASIIYETVDLSFLGGAFNDILTEDSCAGMLCSPETLTPIMASPVSKPGNPFQQGTGTIDWIQVVAHTNVTGAMGTGPDVAAIVAFQYLGPGGFDRLDFLIGETAGDASTGVTGPVFFTSAYVNLPEPGSALLLGLGLLGLANTRRI